MRLPHVSSRIAMVDPVVLVGSLEKVTPSPFSLSYSFCTCLLYTSKRAAWNATPPTCAPSMRTPSPIGLTAVRWCLESAVRPAMGQERTTLQRNANTSLTRQILETNQYSILPDFPGTGSLTYAHGAITAFNASRSRQRFLTCPASLWLTSSRPFKQLPSSTPMYTETR